MTSRPSLPRPIRSTARCAGGYAGGLSGLSRKMRSRNLRRKASYPLVAAPPAPVREIRDTAQVDIVDAIERHKLALAKVQDAWKEKLEERDALAEELRKFRGRKVGSYGPIKKLMRRTLTRKQLSNAALMNELQRSGCTVYHDRKYAPRGTYVEHPKGDSMTYKRFVDAASEVRRALKAKK
jgi:hypothetical protein